MNIKQRTTVVPAGNYSDTTVVPANQYRLSIVIQSNGTRQLGFFPHVSFGTFPTCLLPLAGGAGATNLRQNYHDIFDYGLIAHGNYLDSITVVETYVDDICEIHNTRLLPFRTTGNLITTSTAQPANDRFKVFSANPDRYAVLYGIGWTSSQRWFNQDGSTGIAGYFGGTQINSVQFLDYNDFGPLVQGDLYVLPNGVTDRGAFIEVVRVP